MSVTGNDNLSLIVGVTVGVILFVVFIITIIIHIALLLYKKRLVEYHFYIQQFINYLTIMVNRPFTSPCCCRCVILFLLCRWRSTYITLSTIPVFTRFYSRPLSST